MQKYNTFDFTWSEFKKSYKMAFNIARYINNSNIYINVAFYDKELKDFDSFTDLTINIPITPLKNNGFMLDITKNIEIIASNDTPKELLKTLVKMGILKNTGKTIPSGFANYSIYSFNYLKASKYIINNNL